MRTIICLALACGMILCMGAQPMQFEAFSEDGGGAVYVSDGVYLRTECGHRVICVHGVPTIHYELGDRAAEAHAMVSCLNPDMRLKIARALGYSTRSLHRYQARFESGGMAGLTRTAGRPVGSVNRDRKARGRDRTIVPFVNDYKNWVGSRRSR